MQAVEAQAVRIEQEQRLEADWDRAFTGVLGELDRDPGADSRQSARSLRCVSRGYLAEESSCRAHVPLEAVTAAWIRQLRDGVERGFFRFAWQDEVWLGYGLEDGSVRGVYCPTHSAERDRRVHTARTSAPASPHGD